MTGRTLFDTLKTDEVRDAYIAALGEPHEMIATISRAQLGYIGGLEAVAALYGRLDDSPWKIRLETCKALIIAEAADHRVVSVLEQMLEEPEAVVHNAEVAETEQRDRDFLQRMVEADDTGPLTAEGWADCVENQKTWGTMESILERARQVAGSVSLGALN